MSCQYNRATLRLLLPLRRQTLVLVLAVREELLQGEARRLTRQRRVRLVGAGEVDQRGVHDWQLSSRPRGRTGYSEMRDSLEAALT